jgi:hypothetical protein
MNKKILTFLTLITLSNTESMSMIRVDMNPDNWGTDNREAMIDSTQCYSPEPANRSRQGYSKESNKRTIQHVIIKNDVT